MTTVRPPSAHGSGSSEDDATSRHNSTSAFGRVIACIFSSIGIEDPDWAHINHNGVVKATFTTLTHLVVSCAFDIDGISSLTDWKNIVQALFRTLLLEPRLHASYHSWISEFVVSRILQVVFGKDSCVAEDSPLLADVIEAAVSTRCRVLLPTLYAHLREREWLDIACSVRFHLDEDCDAGMVNDRSYHFMAAAFVRGMNVLQELSSPEYEQTLHYVRKPFNLLSLGKLLMLSDIERRKELQSLVPFIEPSTWASFVSSLRVFIESKEFQIAYEEQACFNDHPYEMSQRIRQFSKRVAGDLLGSTEVETYDKQETV
ncbi:hypothetical protein CPB85DRAFT_1252638 [Mucidula mucida]|nr:hypothetical protein CPB85DRAFT_1252638 [Mucidula mucida]